MTQIIVFALWIMAGIASAAAVPDPSGSRLGWAPISILFGPLWLLVALERKQALEEDPTSWGQPATLRLGSRVESS